MALRPPKGPRVCVRVTDFRSGRDRPRRSSAPATTDQCTFVWKVFEDGVNSLY